MAQDRLWQMEMWRRAAEGRMAEIAGPGRGRARSHGAPAEVPRPLRRLGVDELSPGRQADLHGVRERRERVHRAEQGPPPDRVRRHRHHAGAVDDRAARAARRRRSATPATSCSWRATSRASAPPKPTGPRNPDPPDELVVPDRSGRVGDHRRGVASRRAAGGGGATLPALLPHTAPPRPPSFAKATEGRPGRRHVRARAGQQQLGRRRRRAPPPGIPSSPTIRIARSPTRRSATSSTCRRRAGTSSARASRRLSASRSDTTSASRGA